MLCAVYLCGGGFCGSRTREPEADTMCDSTSASLTARSFMPMMAFHRPNASVHPTNCVLSPFCVQGGGFCGSRTKKLDLDLAAYDGLQLRVKGDGQIFKFNIKTVRRHQPVTRCHFQGQKTKNNLPTLEPGPGTLLLYTDNVFSALKVTYTLQLNGTLRFCCCSCRLIKMTRQSQPTRQPVTRLRTVSGHVMTC